MIRHSIQPFVKVRGASRCHSEGIFFNLRKGQKKQLKLRHEKDSYQNDMEGVDFMNAICPPGE